MRENRLYGSVGGWGLNRPPPTQSIGPQLRAQRGVKCTWDARTIARTAGQETHTTRGPTPRKGLHRDVRPV